MGRAAVLAEGRASFDQRRKVIMSVKCGKFPKTITKAKFKRVTAVEARTQ